MYRAVVKIIRCILSFIKAFLSLPRLKLGYSYFFVFGIYKCNNIKSDHKAVANRN